MTPCRARALVVVAALCLAALPAAAAPIFVNSKADTRANDGVCTLREAIIAANTNVVSGATPGECAAGDVLPVTDVIYLTNVSGSPDLFTLTIAGRDEDAALTGDLDISQSVMLIGESLSETIIQAGTTTANGIDRVFEVVQGGAAIAVSFEKLTIRHGFTTVPAGGVAAHAQGGGINVRAVPSGLASSLTITDASVTLNTALGNGGGIAVAGGFGAITPSLTLLRSEVSSNQSSLGGGGILCSACALTITNSAVLSNTALVTGGLGYGGGAIQLSGDGVASTIANTTIGDNRSNVDGGGMVIPVGSATATMTFATLYLNRADFDANSSGGGGALRNVSGTMSMNRSIVAGNLRHTSTASDCSGTVTSTSYNVLGSTGACITGGTGTTLTANAQLSTLDFHGGATRNYAAIGTSAALGRIPSVDCTSAVDQRGLARPTGGSCEAGAIENSQPGIVADNANMLEDGGPAGLSFTVTDYESLDTLAITAVSSVPSLLANANMTASGTGTARTLTVTPSLNQFGTTNITLTASDGDLSNTDPFTLTVISVNDIPTISPVSIDRTINEDADTGLLSFTIGDVETAAGALTVTGSSTNTTLVPNANIVFSGAGASRSVTITPAANQSGSANITVSVNDGTVSTSTAFLLTVTAVNDTPTISNIANQTPAYGTAPNIPFTVGDVDTTLASLTLSASSSNTTLIPNANLSFGGSGASRSITVAPASGQAGISTITVTVSDGTTSASDTFDVTITAPTISVSDALILEGTGGTVTANVYVMLSQSSLSTVTVQYATSQGTAIAGVDFTTTTGTLSFPSGTTMLPVAVTVTSDAAAEINEWATVTVSNPTNAILWDSSGLLTITDDDTTADQRAALAVWTLPVGVTAATGSLTKTAATGWNAGAASSQAVLSGDASVEFTASEYTIRLIGLSKGNSNPDYADVDFGLYLHNNGTVYVLEGGVTRGIFGNYVIGDRFQIAAESGAVVYRRNGALLYTSAGVVAYPLLIDTALYTTGATLTDVVISGRMAAPVIWTNRVGVNATGSLLTKTGAAAWNGGAASTRGLVSGDGFVETTVLETNTTRMVGLSADNPGVDWSEIDFGLYLFSNATVYIVESGITRGVFGGYSTGDRFQVAIESGIVVYRRNGLLLYTSPVAPTYPLIVDTALYTTGATLKEVALTGELASDATFMGGAGVINNGNTLTNTGAAGLGWTAGAVSVRALVRDDGFVEFTTLEANTNKMAGLSRGNSSNDYADVDFAVLLAANTYVYVFEGGVSRGLFGTYEAGDRFRVAVEGGVVKYRKNGVLFYTSAVAPVSPLLVDTSLFTIGATIADVVQYGELGETVSWTAATNVTAVGNALTKTGALGWNAGAISTRAIASGNGYVTFTTSEANTHKLVGLSVGNANSDYADVDFGILLASNGTFYVFEGGVSRGVFGSYVAGTQFSVAVEGGVVRYLKNGVGFYNSAVAPAYPLLIDTSLYSVGATITDVVLGCVTTGCQ